jgi:hypothetical protein
MKMPEPRTPPMTKKVASSRPSDRRREGGFAGRDDGDFIVKVSLMTSLCEQGKPRAYLENHNCAYKVLIIL